MHLSFAAIVVAARPHGETAAIVRVLSEQYGLVAGYVAGARGRHLRPVLIPGNRVAAELSGRSDSQMPFLRLELVESRGPWLSEPLAAGAIAWVTTLTAAVLPERNAYPNIYSGLSATLDAICHAPSARGWLRAVIAFEALVLRELGYGGTAPPAEADLEALLQMFARLGVPLERYLLADRKGDAMAARAMLGERLEKLKP
ncbi:recombination protein O N-terminal domain-containing protein [Altererythrobacter sp. TH136]|uniref:DNA repair protein RecO n=1 Tax=Altererythrobacter sp. TH136 TaxID=2067415 RepID=UPI0011622E6D|nr:recombination protein O N-terminal domain-containing protein [Altererythrobacter sp. TH136]QDM39699.1 DNA recombination protein RecO [Altererythrobacter sp. TH136]